MSPSRVLMDRIKLGGQRWMLLLWPAGADCERYLAEISLVY